MLGPARRAARWHAEEMTSALPPEHTARARSFELGAADYRRARPGYPVEAVRWLAPESGPRVLDLAAGTGKLTEVLVALDLDVVAVEPSAAMRAELTDALPGVTVLPGTAEDIPLPDGDRDGVVVGQAWHWFHEEAAQREVARVLRPGGRLGVVWNVRDTTVDWVAAFTEIVHRGDELLPSYHEPRLDERFTDLEHTTIPWTQELAAGDLRTLAASRSHLLTVDPQTRDALLADVDALVATHPALAGRDRITVPYRAECFRSRRV